MIIREYTPEDLSELVRIYQESGFDYPFPELSDPIFFEKLVLEDRGRLEIAAVGRHTCELYLFMDKRNQARPAEMWAKFKKLHQAFEQKVRARGLDDMHAWLPPAVAPTFGKQLVDRLGWVRDDRYKPFCKYVEKGGADGPRE
jgi:hypothetical protein